MLFFFDHADFVLPSNKQDQPDILFSLRSRNNAMDHLFGKIRKDVFHDQADVPHSSAFPFHATPSFKPLGAEVSSVSFKKTAYSSGDGFENRYPCE